MIKPILQCNNEIPIDYAKCEIATEICNMVIGKERGKGLSSVGNVQTELSPLCIFPEKRIGVSC